MAWEVGSPSSAVNEPPPLPADGAVGAEAGIGAWISGPETGSSCSGGGEGWRIGAAEAALSGTRGVAVRGAEAREALCGRVCAARVKEEGKGSEEKCRRRRAWLAGCDFHFFVFTVRVLTFTTGGGRRVKLELLVHSAPFQVESKASSSSSA
jgi:hypothetical protein